MQEEKGGEETAKTGGKRTKTVKLITELSLPTKPYKQQQQQLITNKTLQVLMINPQRKPHKTLVIHN